MKRTQPRVSKQPTNLVQVKPPNKEFSFKSGSLSPSPPNICLVAVKKFYTSQEMQEVFSYRRSAITDEALQADFLRCDTPDHNVIKDKHYKRALQIVADKFKPPSLCKPVHYCDLRFYPWTLNSSVEQPFVSDPVLIQMVQQAHAEQKLSSASMNLHNCYNYVFQQVRPMVHQIKEGRAKGNKFMFPNTAHARSHLVKSDEPDKVRMVHGVSKVTLFIECMLLWTFFKFLRLGSTPIAWGYETIKGGIYRIYNEVSQLKRRPNLWLALDWSQFDKLARFTIIDDIHTILLSYMDFSSGYHPTKTYPSTTTKPIRLHRLWKWMNASVKFNPIRLPDGSLWKRTHSTIASGLLQTQVLDTMINLTMLITVLLALGIPDSDIVYMLALGDDSLFGLSTILNCSKEEFLSKIASTALTYFGAILSSKKSRITTTLEGTHFLGYSFHNAMPIRDEFKLLAQLCFPERRWTIERLAARAVGIAYANCGYHRRVYLVCKDIYDYCTSTLGATPNIIGSKYLTYISKFVDIDLTSFPSQDKICAELLSVPRLNPSLEERFFSKEHFF